MAEESSKFKKNANSTIMDYKLVFKEVYLENWEKIYLYAFNVLKNKKLSEDIVQDIFVMFWKNRQKWVEIENISAYLYQAVKFQCFRCFRDKKGVSVDIDRFNDVLRINSMEDNFNKQDTEYKLDSYLNELPKKCRDIFYLSRNENLSHSEIADRLGVSRQTVKNQITLALKYLRTNLEKASS